MIDLCLISFTNRVKNHVSTDLINSALYLHQVSPVSSHYSWFTLGKLVTKIIIESVFVRCFVIHHAGGSAFLSSSFLKGLYVY